MNKAAFKLLLGMSISFLIPMNANGEQRKIKTDGINIYRSRNNDLYINTENMEFYHPNKHSRSRPNLNNHNGYDYAPSWCRNNNIVRQYSRQVNQSGSLSSHASTSRNSCR